MPGPVLLVADDLSTIAAVKRVLAREGYEVVLATNAADALIAWGHHLPGLVLLQPSVETDRGGVVLEEIQQLPDAALLHCIILGETLPGFAYPVEPLPIDPEHFAVTVAENIRAGGEAEAWKVREAAQVDEPEPTPSAPELETWRSTRPHEVTQLVEAPAGLQDDLPAEVPSPPPEPAATADDLHEAAPVPQPPPEPQARPDPPMLEEEVPPRPSPPPPPAITVPGGGALENKLFGDLGNFEDELARDVEAQAMANVDSTLARDEELNRLEEEVRAEAARRRRARADSAIQPAPPHPEAPDPSPSPDFELGPSVSATSAAAAAAPSPTALAALARAEAILEDSRAAAEAARAAHDTLTQAALERDELAQALEATRAELTESKATSQVDGRRLENLEADLESSTRAADAAEARARELAATVEQLKGQLDAASENALQLQTALDAEREAHAQAEEKAVKNEGLAEDLQSQLQASQAAHTEAAAALSEARAELEAAQARLGETQKALEKLNRSQAEQAKQLEAARSEAAELTQVADALKEKVDATRARAEAAEADGQTAHERLKELEQRQLISLELPGRGALGVPRNDTVELDGLAALMGQLVLARADGRLEMGARGGTRTLWLKNGQVMAAESTFDFETLIDRARRDGLIDGRQESELRLVRNATPGEQLEAMRQRGLIREAEAAPLVQRFTEQVALEAFTEDRTQYRLSEDPPGEQVLTATVPRPTLTVLAEALRRALPVGALLEKLGGAEATVVALDSELDLRTLGFSERERKMLTWVDGEATVEDLTLASGLKPDVAWRSLLVARLLGVIDLKPPRTRAKGVSPELDVRRLEAKYDEVQDADYFTILGLPRSAGTDEVERAFERLSAEFDPLKYSAHPDAALQQRAQLVHDLLEEAARALGDERRRADYARHLLD